jgi:RecA/RadA recombinase
MQLLSNGIEFSAHSLREPFVKEGELSKLPKDLANALGSPEECERIQNGRQKIYLGDGAVDPNGLERFPLGLPADLLSQHLLIAGVIGSGKTSLIFRLIAGALRTYGSVAIGEAKAGYKGEAKGAAYNDLANYLVRKFPELKVLRWPRGNCWFNPLLYLKTPQDRRAFFDSLCNQIKTENSIDGETSAFVSKATKMAECIFRCLQLWPPRDNMLTLRQLVTFLKNPQRFQQAHNDLSGDYERLLAEGRNTQAYLDELAEINLQLQRLNFFSFVGSEKFIMTSHGVNLLIDQLDHKDLLDYSEPRADLPELKIDDLLYNLCLVIVSQPLYDPSSRVVGPLFWDSLLARVVELGTDPKLQGERIRQKVLAVLDETHRLPVGRLGESGDFLREYNVGLVEITPTIVDEERWNRNKHVYQTLISLSPGVPAVVQLMQSRLPNFFRKRFHASLTHSNQKLHVGIASPEEPYEYLLSQDNPGVTARSLEMTGQFTGLVQSHLLDDERKVFWVDFKNELLGNIKQLLREALSPDCPPDIVQAVDYALGLRPEPPDI